MIVNVVDTSAVVRALIEGGVPLHRLTAPQEVFVAPAHLDAEVGHALRGLARGGVISDEQGSDCIADLRKLPVTRIPASTLVERAWELRKNATFYDALFVALAEELGCSLLTCDARFLGIPGIRCAIERL